MIGIAIEVKRGEIYLADLPEGMGSEQKGIRPVLIVQDDGLNMNSPTVIILIITSKLKKNGYAYASDVAKSMWSPKAICSFRRENEGN